uniref:Protein VACUOLELESS1 n=1 Tax=Oryza barthii TaxID=65489 RepID=A0A0D3ES82_9ORYZ
MSSSVSVAAEWDLLSDRFYRRITVYSPLPCSLNLVALLSDGSLLRFRLPDLKPNPSPTPVPLLPTSSGGVADAAFWGGGVAVLTEDNHVVVTTDIDAADPHPREFADPCVGQDEQVLCMAVVEPQFVMSGSPEVLLAVGDRVLAVDEDDVQTLGLELEIGPVQKMAVSPNGKLLAAFAHDGRLLVIPTDFSKIIFEYECDSALPPDQIAWCGLDSVLLYWSEALLMVGPNGDPVLYNYDEPIKLIPECDGVRILSNSNMEFLHRVPDSTTSIFGIGSMSPAALLYDARDHYDKQSAKAYDNYQLISSSLPEAIEACIDAAGHEFDISRQHALLRAATYGLAFCSQFPHERFQEMCKTLRVLNAVRDPQIGMPLTIQQYKLLTAPVLIGRLINANQHLLALRISEYLNLNPEVVIMHWACEKITASAAIPDTVLLEGLLDKIPLLLSIDEQDKALSKAIESGDTDLVYLVLFHIWQKVAVEKSAPLDFFGVINARPLARDLFMAYARHSKHEALKDFFLSTGRLQLVISPSMSYFLNYREKLQDAAFLLLKESRELERNPMASKGSPLHGPQVRLIEQAHRLFAETKEHVFESKASEEHAKLLRSQHELEVSTKQAIFVGSSVSDTIKTCIAMGNERAALKVKSEFKVPDKRWYWLKSCALATVGNWDALEKFSKERRPPGGYKPFVEACIDAGQKTEALKYIPKLTDPRERSERYKNKGCKINFFDEKTPKSTPNAYARIKMAKEAAEAASQVKDSDELFGRLKLTLAQNTAAASIFDTLRDRLSFQGTY